jgi:hypothetical protein
MLVKRTADFSTQHTLRSRVKSVMNSVLATDAGAPYLARLEAALAP